MKVFSSYRFADERFVRSVNYYLKRQSDLVPYCFGEETHTENWVSEVSKELARADAFLIFLGAQLGGIQSLEGKALLNLISGREVRVIKLPGFPGFGILEDLALFSGFYQVSAKEVDEQSAQQCAKEITNSLGKQWVPVDDIPDEYVFDYEKDIIQAYSQDSIAPKLVGKGCPTHWPSVERKETRIESPLKEEDVGLFRDWDKNENKYRDGESLVLAGALKELSDQQINKSLCFPEAGPRKALSYPATPLGLKVGILVSGGIAPGINAVIAGIVERQTLYADQGRYNRLLINGYQNGLNAIYYPGANYRALNSDDVVSRADRGGSVLGTSRLEDFMSANPLTRRQALETAVGHLAGDGIEILYIIGGDGSMRAAHSISKTAQELGHNMSVIGVPKTMDNDILWVWQAFGFLSAVERSRNLIQELYTEAKSNPRLGVIQLFGSDSGFVVTHAVSASGVCDLFLIPEVPFTMTKICKYMADKLRQRYQHSPGLQSTYGMIVMSETAIPQDAEDYFDDPKVGLTNAEKEAISSFLKQTRVFGQTPDELRSGGLKLVSRVIEQYINESEEVFPQRYWRKFRVFTNEPRHQIRAI